MVFPPGGPPSDPNDVFRRQFPQIRPLGETPKVLEAHLETYVVYVPEHLCRFCRKVTDEESFVPPARRAYECPHTRKADLDALLLEHAQERAEVLKMHEPVTLQSGVVQVTVSWRRVAPSPQGMGVPTPKPPPDRL